MSSRLARIFGSVLGAVRDFWLMIGILILLLVALDAGYRGQAGVRRTVAAWRAMSAPSHPYSDSAWFQLYDTEASASFHLRWEPYVYWTRVPFQGQLVNIDSAGRRRTVHPDEARDPVRKVFFFGGSTAYGSFQRDNMTLPSCVAAYTSDLPGAPGLEVTNFGETGYVFTQEVIQLMLELRRGSRPHAVVFYDGINDVVAAIQNGSPGVPQNERNRQEDFELGRTVHAWRGDLASDARVLAALAIVAGKRLQFPQRLAEAARGRVGETRAHSRQTEADFVASYLATVGIVEALAKAYGFQVLYIWQPTLSGSPKTFTPYEKWLIDGVKGDRFQNDRLHLHRSLPPMLDSAMRPMVGERFVDLSRLFTGDPSPVYVDQTGHTTEYAVPIIVRGFWGQLARILGLHEMSFSPRKGFCGGQS